METIGGGSFHTKDPVITRHAQIASSANARTSRFFSLYNQYLIEPSAKPIDVVDDIRLLLAPVMANIDLLASSLSDENGDIADNPKIVGRVLRGVFYQLEMIDGLVGAIEVRQ